MNLSGFKVIKYDNFNYLNKIIYYIFKENL